MKTNDAEIRKTRIAASLDGMRDKLFGDGSPLRTGDAPEAMAFLVSQLAHVESNVWEKLRQPMQYARLIPVDTSAGEYAQSIEYETRDYAGRGKKHSGKGNDIPRVDVATGRETLPVSLGAIGYDYTMEELRVSAYLRRPLDTDRAMVAGEAYERHINEVAMNGEAESGFTGFYNNASVPAGNVPAGTGGTTWLTKTALEILKDVNDAITAVWTATQFNDVPTTIVLPPTRFSHIATTPVSSTQPDRTILQYLKENNLAKVERGVDLEFVAGYGNSAKGSGATERMVVYTKNPTRIKMHLPMPLRFLAPQPEGLSVLVPGEYKYGRVHWYYPKSGVYRDGI